MAVYICILSHSEKGCDVTTFLMLDRVETHAVCSSRGNIRESIQYMRSHAVVHVETRYNKVTSNLNMG